MALVGSSARVRRVGRCQSSRSTGEGSYSPFELGIRTFVYSVRIRPTAKGCRLQVRRVGWKRWTQLVSSCPVLWAFRMETLNYRCHLLMHQTHSQSGRPAVSKPRTRRASDRTKKLRLLHPIGPPFANQAPIESQCPSAGPDPPAIWKVALVRATTTPASSRTLTSSPSTNAE